jgi:hypothetical protein
MLKLTDSLEAWGGPDFETAMKEEIQRLDHKMLPLQEGLSQSSHVSDAKISVVILKVSEARDSICVKTGVFYAGIIAGSCCADDPTPVTENTEYCEVLFDINKITAETVVTLHPEDKQNEPV